MKTREALVRQYAETCKISKVPWMYWEKNRGLGWVTCSCVDMGFSHITQYRLRELWLVDLTKATGILEISGENPDLLELYILRGLVFFSKDLAKKRVVELVEV